MGTCDWGQCDGIATHWRYSNEHGWLPVCEDCAGHETGSDAPTQRLGIDDAEQRRADCIAPWDGPCDCGDECLYDPRHGTPAWCSCCGSHATREPSGICAACLAKTVVIEPRGKPEPLYRIVWASGGLAEITLTWASLMRALRQYAPHTTRRISSFVARVERVN